MFRRLLPLVALAAACTNNVTSNDTVADIVDDGEAEAAVNYAEPQIATEHIYFGINNHAQLSEEAPLFYADFDLVQRAKVDIRVSRADGDENAGVGFKVYRVNPRGTLRL